VYAVSPSSGLPRCRHPVISTARILLWGYFIDTLSKHSSEKNVKLCAEDIAPHQWRNDGVAAASRDGGPHWQGGPRQLKSS